MTSSLLYALSPNTTRNACVTYTRIEEGPSGPPLFSLSIQHKQYIYIWLQPESKPVAYVIKENPSKNVTVLTGMTLGSAVMTTRAEMEN
jgi:hypothetical protein